MGTIKIEMTALVKTLMKMRMALMMLKMTSTDSDTDDGDKSAAAAAKDNKDIYHFCYPEREPRAPRA